MKIGAILGDGLLYKRSSSKELKVTGYANKWSLDGKRCLHAGAYLFDYSGELVLNFVEDRATLCNPHEKPRDMLGGETYIDGQWYDFADDDEVWHRLEKFAFPDNIEHADAMVENYGLNMGLTWERRYDYTGKEATLENRTDS